MKQNYSRMILNGMNISIIAILIVALVVHSGAPILPIYAEKCDQDDSKCDSKKASDTDGENCKVEDPEDKDKDKDKDNQNSNMNIQNSNAQSSNSVECTENDSQSNPHSLGEGPYSFPTDFSELPIS